MAQVLRHRPLTAETPVRFRVGPCQICDGKTWPRHRVFCLFLVNIITQVLHTHPYLNVAFTRRTLVCVKPGEPTKKECSFENRGAFVRKLLQLYKARLQSCGKRILALSCPSVRPSTRKNWAQTGRILTKFGI